MLLLLPVIYQDLKKSLPLLKDKRKSHLVCLIESVVHAFWDNHTAALADKEFPSNKYPRFSLHSSWQIEFLLLSSGLSHQKSSSSTAVTSLSWFLPMASLKVKFL